MIIWLFSFILLRRFLSAAFDVSNLRPSVQKFSQGSYTFCAKICNNLVTFYDQNTIFASQPDEKSQKRKHSTTSKFKEVIYCICSVPFQTLILCKVLTCFLLVKTLTYIFMYKFIIQQIHFV